MVFVNRLSKIIIIIILNIAILEGLSFVLVQIRYGGVEVFNVRGFTELVEDERLVTLKANAKVEEYWGSIETNDLRLRVPPSVTTEELSDQDNFLFIGDSVPFGWGGEAKNSLPYILNEKVKSLAVLNGAIPSYSLQQAVSRFKHEFSNLENVQYVYLQIYDPVSQYAILGANWRESDNWTNFQNRKNDLCSLIKVAKYSNFIFLVNKLYKTLLGSDCGYTPSTHDSDVRLKKHIFSQIRMLRSLTSDETKVIVAPVTPSPSGLNSLPEQYHEAYFKVNEALKDASKAFGLIFLDTNDILDSQDYFVDQCCHLSRTGAEKVANELVDIIDQK